MKKKDLDRLIQDRIRLAKAEPGGSRERPIDVQSPSQIDLRATAQQCLKCDSETRVLAHEADLSGDVPLRVVVAACRRCGGRRTYYFRVVRALEN